MSSNGPTRLAQFADHDLETTCCQNAADAPDQCCPRANKNSAARPRVELTFIFKLSALFESFKRLCSGKCSEPKRKETVRLHVKNAGAARLRKSVITTLDAVPARDGARMGRQLVPKHTNLMVASGIHVSREFSCHRPAKKVNSGLFSSLRARLCHSARVTNPRG